MSLVTSSISVYAEEVDSSTVKVNIYAMDDNTDFGQVNIDNGGTGSFSHDDFLAAGALSGGYNWGHRYTFVKTDGNPLFEAGKKVTFSARNFYLYAEFQGQNYKVTGYYDDFFFMTSTPLLIYLDGSREELDKDLVEVIFNPATNTYDYKLTITPDKDVYKLVLIDIMRNNQSNDTSTATSILYSVGAQGLNISLDVQDEDTAGLFDILGWVKKIADYLVNVRDYILNLPQRIWESFQTGIVNLFVPSQDALASFKDKWDELLSDRLGAVYESVVMLRDSWDGVMAADQTNTIEFPLAVIDLPEGEQFAFGGYTVRVVPQGFGILANTVKTAVGIMCTVLFINGLRKRYDEVMGVKR